MIKAKVLGGKEIDAAFKQLETKTTKKYLRRSLRKGGKVVEAAIKPLAPVDEGDLKASIKTRGAGGGRKKVSVKVGVGKKWFKGDEFYGAFQEYGFHIGKRPTRSKKTKPTPETRKKVPGKHFVQRGFESSKEGAVTTIMIDLSEQLTAGIPEIAAANRTQK